MNPGDFETQVLGDTRRWLERAVIGLNLCPFAKAVHARGQIHFAFYGGDEPAGLADLMLREAAHLVGLPSEARDTTLIVAPRVFHDFLAFFQEVARLERRLARAGHEGVLQLASFHPRFQFAGTDEDAISNATNRAPYPTLHLLREASIDRAVQAFPRAEAIFERNIAVLDALGHEGWAALGVGPGKVPR